MWSALAAICRKIERLQTSAAARSACGEVGERLAEIIADEEAAVRSKRS